eukprot:jgi/Hompol1/1019/HPOL_004418-RA
MPKSKRSKIVNLTKTDKKGREDKEKLFAQIRDSVDKYSYIYVFEVLNMRNAYLKEVRADWATSRIFLGRTKIMAKALGTTEEEEYQQNLRHFSEKVEGSVGLLFTDSNPEEVKTYFQTKRETDFARGGAIATDDVVIPAGPVMRGELKFPNNMEPQLRKLGMPTSLSSGVITLANPYTICRKGDTLTPEQAHLLKHFGFHLAEFHIVPKYGFHDGQLIEMSMDNDTDQ